MLDTWYFNLIVYLILDVLFTQLYKITTKKSTNDGALTVLLELLGGLFVLLLFPFFSIQFPKNVSTYIFFGIAIIFYATAYRINTTTRRMLDVSTYSILSQLSTVFVITWGIIFLKETIVLKEIFGAFLILLGNVFVLYKKGKFELNKYVIIHLLGTLSMSIAISIDVGISKQFNLSLYVSFILFVPALLLLVFERIKVKDIISELKNGNSKAILLIGMIWGVAIIERLRAYSFGTVTTIAPLIAIRTILNVFAAYFVLKEKDSLWKKIVAALIVVAGTILIKI